MKGVAPLIQDVSFDTLLADKAFDADWLLKDIDTRGATAVIPQRPTASINAGKRGLITHRLEA